MHNAISQISRRTSLCGFFLAAIFLLQAMPAMGADLSFLAIQGSANPSAQTITITNSGKGPLNWKATDDAAWLSVTPTSGRTKRTDAVKVMVDISGLGANTYTGTITILGSGATTTQRQIQVQLTVTAPGPNVGIMPTSLSFVGTTGGTNPASQSVHISNTGMGTLTWSVSDDAPWLTVSPATGTTTTETDALMVSVNVAGLGTNTYQATVTVSDPKAPNSPRQVPVTLALTAPQSSLATLTWDAPLDTSVAGHKVYVGTASRTYGPAVDAGNATTFKVINLLKGQTYYFAITAYDALGNESDFSNEVSKTMY